MCCLYAHIVSRVARYSLGSHQPASPDIIPAYFPPPLSQSLAWERFVAGFLTDTSTRAAHGSGSASTPLLVVSSTIASGSQLNRDFLRNVSLCFTTNKLPLDYGCGIPEVVTVFLIQAREVYGELSRTGDRTTTTRIFAETDPSFKASAEQISTGAA